MSFINEIDEMGDMKIENEINLRNGIKKIFASSYNTPN